MFLLEADFVNALTKTEATKIRQQYHKDQKAAKAGSELVQQPEQAELATRKPQVDTAVTAQPLQIVAEEPQQLREAQADAAGTAQPLRSVAEEPEQDTQEPQVVTGEPQQETHESQLET